MGSGPTRQGRTRERDELRQRWVEELHQQGFTPPTVGVEHRGVAIGRVNRDAVAALVLSRLGARRSAWNAADIRGEAKRIIAAVDVVAPAPVRHELVEDLTDRTVARCVPLLVRDDVPEHVRTLTSREVLEVEADLIARLAARAEQPATSDRVGTVVARRHLDCAQRQVVAALGGTAPLLVIEGAAGAGKTTTMAAASELLEMQDARMIVVTPTLKAARVAEEQLGAAAFTSAWLVHQHGFRWDSDGHWSRHPVPREALPAYARLLPGDLLLVDEAGMLDQDVARALLTIADETKARVAFVGDRHQLPAVGRGGVLDHAARWARPEACLELETVHRFTDPEYADLTLLMRTGKRPGEVFDRLNARGLIHIHPTEVERLAALTDADGTVIADTREQVTTLNTAIRDQRLATGETSGAGAVTTTAGERLSAGDQIATRRNDRNLGVANRDQWTVTSTNQDGGLVVQGRGGARTLPAHYVREHVELAYATTVHGAQGDTVDQAHLLIGEATGAAAAYVSMTRGRGHRTLRTSSTPPRQRARRPTPRTWVRAALLNPSRPRPPRRPSADDQKRRDLAHLIAQGPTLPLVTKRGQTTRLEVAPMNPIEIPDDWDDRGLLTFEEFCALIRTTTHRPRLAPTRRRSAVGTIQRLRPPLHHRG